MRFALASLLSLCLSASLCAQDAPKEVLRKKGELAKDDAKDTVLTKSYRQVQSVKLEAGQIYRVDLESDDFDPFLRLENPSGKVLAEDDDGGEGVNARIVYKAERTGPHRLVVTSFDPDKIGKYILTVTLGTRKDLLAGQLKKLNTMTAAERGAFLGELKKHLQERGAKLDIEDVKMAYFAGMALEGDSTTQAADAFEEFGGLLAKSSDDQVAGFAVRMAGAARRLRLPGQEIAFKGTTLEGKAFDLKNYRGKVVLVDFWATWCGPCRAEFPSMRRLYAAYKDKGFEIVGVSTDRDRDALERFQDKEKLPWICLHEKEAKEQPLSTHFGIFSIPLCILVDRDGKVVSMRARGPELERLLEQYVKGIRQ